MLFGEKQRGKVIDDLQESLESYTDNRPSITHEKIRKSAKIVQDKVQSYNKRYVNQKRQKTKKYEVGDYVMVKNCDCNVGVARKLIPKFKGPYMIFKVLKNDRIVQKDVEGFQQSQIPYLGVWAVGNLRPWFGKNAVPCVDHGFEPHCDDRLSSLSC